MDLTVHPVGLVSSPVTDPADAALQGDEGAPTIGVDDTSAVAAADLVPGDRLLVLTWSTWPIATCSRCTHAAT